MLSTGAILSNLISMGKPPGGIYYGGQSIATFALNLLSGLFLLHYYRKFFHLQNAQKLHSGV